MYLSTGFTNTNENDMIMPHDSTSDTTTLSVGLCDNVQVTTAESNLSS